MRYASIETLKVAGNAWHDYGATPAQRQGAAFAAIDGERLLFPPTDYEQPLPPEVMAGEPFLTQGTLHFGLGGDARMIGAGKPHDGSSLLSGPAGENILDRVVEDMSDGQDTGYVGGWDDNGISRLAFRGFTREAIILFPTSVPSILDLAGVVGFRYFRRVAHGLAKSLVRLANSAALARKSARSLFLKQRDVPLLEDWGQ